MANEIIVSRIGIELFATADKSSAKNAAKEMAEEAQKVSQTTFSKMGSSLKNAYVSGAWGAMKSALSGILGLTKRLISPVTKLTDRFGKFFAAIKRIAIYRAIRWALKEIVQGFQEGRENAYQWAVIAGNQFAKSMDMMATSALYLKNSLGAMTMPLTNYLAPILDSLIDKFVDLINLINQFFATITGASTWVKALKYPAQYLEQAAGSAKELKNQLLGFDELNILKAPNLGGGGSALDYSNMFQEMQLSVDGKSFFDSLKDAIKKGDWKGVGKLFADKFNQMIASIDAMSWAKWLGDKINNALTLVHTLLTESDFSQVGQKIGEFMSNLRLDWAKISGSWLRWKLNILEAFLSIVRNVNWGNIGHAIGEAVKGLLNGFATWLNELGTRQQSFDLSIWLTDIIAGVDWNGVLQAFYRALAAVLRRGFEAGLRGALGDWAAEGIMSLLGYTYTGSNNYSSVTSAAVVGAASGAITMHANGGFPNQGTMFIAGEDGAEFVGQIGGRTGV